MTLYVGETTRVKSTAKDFDDVSITDADNVAVVVTIWRKSDNVIVKLNEALTWDSEHEYWFYDWDTNVATPISAGTYVAQVVYTGITYVTWEYKQIKFKAKLI